MTLETLLEELIKLPPEDRRLFITMNVSLLSEEDRETLREAVEKELRRRRAN